MSLMGTFFTGVAFGFIVAVVVIGCSVISKEEEAYSNGFYDGYIRGKVDAEDEDNRC